MEPFIHFFYFYTLKVVSFKWYNQLVRIVAVKVFS